MTYDTGVVHRAPSYSLDAKANSVNLAGSMPATDTIVALSSPAGESAIALIRLSGPVCADLGQAISGRSQPLRKRFAHFAKYLDIKGDLLDECVITYFPEGQSFTGVDGLPVRNFSLNVKARLFSKACACLNSILSDVD